MNIEIFETLVFSYLTLFILYPRVARVVTRLSNVAMILCYKTFMEFMLYIYY